ncbi:MAG: DUF5684 domain-containing protein [Planctomycetaceae bacterium]
MQRKPDPNLVRVFPEEQELNGQQTMPIKIRCKVCEAGLKLPDAAMGKVVKCPKCANRIKVPTRRASSADEGSRSAEREQQKAASTGFLSALGSLPLEDQRAKICPRCGQDVDPELGECLDCGIDIETGQLTKKRAREVAQKGADPKEFYKYVLKDFFVFPFKNFGLIGRSILVSAFAYLLFAFARVFINGSDSETIELFMAFIASIAIALFTGWLWSLSIELVKFTFAEQATIKKKKKPKPYKPNKADVLYWFQCGYIFMAWVLCNVIAHALILTPILLLLSMVVVYTGSSTSLLFLIPVGILVGLSALIILFSIPLAIGHMSMPVTWQAWNPFKLMQLAVRTAVPGLVWSLLLLICVSIPIVIYGFTYDYVKNDINATFEPLRFNAEISAARGRYFSPTEDIPPEIIELRRRKPIENYPILPWFIAELILTGAFSISAAFFIGATRSVSHLVYFNQHKLDLIREAQAVTYKVIDKRKYLPIPFRSDVGKVWMIGHMIFGLFCAGDLVLAFGAGIPLGFMLKIVVFTYLLVFLPNLLYMDGLCRVFEKTNNNGMTVFAPFYREFVQFKAAGLPIVWFLMFLFVDLLIGVAARVADMEVLNSLVVIPLIGILFISLMVIWIYMNIKMAERFDKPISYGLGLAFLSPVFYTILGRSMDRARRLPTDPLLS